jgi:DNA-directed RNA polymerase specialized sigma24 family protein
MPAIAHDGFGLEEDVHLYVLTERATWRLIRERQVTWDNDERQDFVADTYTYRILPQRERLYGRPEHSQRAFIYQAVEWGYFDKIKWEGKQPQLLKDDAKLEFLPRATYEPDHSEGMLGEQAQDFVEQALQTLSPYERAVWILRERYEWSFRHISKRLRTHDGKRRKEATLTVAYYRATRKIEAFLKAKVIRV